MWAELKRFPLSLGFVGAWSMPIKSREGKVLGTFDTYYRPPHEPTPEEVAGVQTLADAAASVLTKSHPTNVCRTYANERCVEYPPWQTLRNLRPCFGRVPGGQRGNNFPVGVVGRKAEFGVDFVGQFVGVFEALGLVVDGFHGNLCLVGQIGFP